MLVALAGIIFSSPNFFDRSTLNSMPEWLPTQQVSLGLDLQGGSHLLLEVEVDVVVRERLESLTASVRSILRRNRIGYNALGISGGDAVTFRLRDPLTADKTLSELKTLAAPASGILGAVGTPDLEIEVDDSGLVTVKLTESAIRDRKTAAVAQSIEIVRRRIDETGTREPTIQRQGDDRILVQLPGVDDPDRIKRLLGKTAKLVFRMVDSTVAPIRGKIPAGSEILESDENVDGVAVREYVVRKRIMVSGDMLIDAQPSFQDGQPVVSFRFDSVGGTRFGKATKENVGKLFAIVLDNKVISAPVIREPILGGQGQISGGFTVQGAQDLALLLRAGALPAPLKILEERTVGPDLGADSIAAGKIASVIGFVAVILFMALVYGLFGMVANLALVINMAIIFGALSVLQATLTLPGIAGIVLTIGMAVDANVLVFERIREEVANGKTPLAAVEAGYKRAYSTILDANITTFIAAVILYQMGSGPIKGFAVTLAIGILTSVFTAVMLSRLVVSIWLRRRRPTELPL